MKEAATYKKQILLPFQGIRALAFMGIFLSHTSVDVLSSSGLGAWGVSIFIILSGFLMTINYYPTGRLLKCSVRDSFKFSLRKLSSLYPLHIVMMLSALPFEVKAIVNNAVGGVLYSCIILSAKMFFNITMTQSFVPHSGIHYSLNAVSWYLSVCLLTYFCFPWILRYFRKGMSVRKANVLISLLLVLQVVMCWFSSKINLSISDGFTKWFVYNFPVMRMIDFILGAVLGYVYLARTDNKNDGNGRTDKSHRSEMIADIIFVAITILLVGTHIIFSTVTPQDSAMNHPELWWRYSCLFTLLNGVLIYQLGTDKGIICRLVSNKVFVFIGGISSSTFLIHQMIIRYVGVFNRFTETDNILLSVICKVVIPFLLTIMAYMIWNRIYQLIKFKAQAKRRN